MVAVRSPTGIVVEVSESLAERMKLIFGYVILTQPEKPAASTTAPASAAPKRRGRPKKETTP